ncbi:MAG: galactosyldiacylglycerol synthase [Acidobacteria bacterium]|nr:galactosyldiacylglycerol synthase [Acidobacteriota bacterium]
MESRPDVDFIFFDAGGGHRAAARALEAVAGREGRAWNIRLVDLQDVLDELDIFRKLTGLRLEDIYNRLLENGWTLGSTQLLPLMHGVIRLYHSAQVRVLAKYWGARPPAMVVSLVPNFSRSQWQALQRVDPKIPFVTILTDMADYPPSFWIERQKQTFICGTDRAVEQARQISPESTAHRVSGMILNPKFYDVAPVDRAAERRALGLDPTKPTGLVLFGGMGSDKMESILKRIDESSLDVQLVLICGKNEKLRKRLEARTTRILKFVEGFTKDIPRYMQLADFFIGKPGPGSISEAIQMGLPVIVEKNSWTLPQERFNADWVTENSVGESLASFREIVPALERLLHPARLAECQANAAVIRNDAVFEITAILDTILECASRPASS